MDASMYGGLVAPIMPALSIAMFGLIAVPSNADAPLGRARDPTAHEGGQARGLAGAQRPGRRRLCAGPLSATRNTSTRGGIPHRAPSSPPRLAHASPDRSLLVNSCLDGARLRAGARCVPANRASTALLLALAARRASCVAKDDLLRNPPQTLSQFRHGSNRHGICFAPTSEANPIEEGPSSERCTLATEMGQTSLHRSSGEQFPKRCARATYEAPRKPTQ